MGMSTVRRVMVKSSRSPSRRTVTVSWVPSSPRMRVRGSIWAVSSVPSTATSRSPG